MKSKFLPSQIFLELIDFDNLLTVCL